MLGNLFNVFSRRGRSIEPESGPFPKTFRNRVLLYCRDILAHDFEPFLEELQRKMAYLHGRPFLSQSGPSNERAVDDVLQFLFECEDNHFLDFIELIFQLEQANYFSSNDEAAVEQLNQFLAIDDIPYILTKSVWIETKKDLGDTHITSRQRSESPKIICKESELVHENSIAPALAILSHTELANANEEFLLALEDYRKQNYKDALTKCSSALESLMKVICERRELAYSQSDTTRKLLDTILSNSSLDGFWIQPLMSTATIRNKLSYSHGAGSTRKSVTKHIANYSINSTAAAMLLLYDEAFSGKDG